MINVDDLVRKLSLSELNEAADNYWKRLINNPRLLAKPFNLGDAEHILPQLGFLIQGLQLYAGMAVLDFGAGSCYASRILNQMGLRVTSMDVSINALEIGRRLREKCPPVGEAPEHVFTVGFDLPDESGGRIICLDALYHVRDQNTVLREMSRVLKEGGVAGFSEPGPHYSRSSEAQFEMRYRFLLSSVDVEPGSTISGVGIDLGILEPGEYRLDIDLVSEYVCWFQSQCDSMISIRGEVR